jgi:hypothetical protein
VHPLKQELRALGIGSAPARALGGHGLLVLTGQGTTHRGAAETLDIPEAADLEAAVEAILK